VWQTTQPDKIPKFQTSATAPNTNISDNALCFYYLYEDKIKKKLQQSGLVEHTIWDGVGSVERKWLSATSKPKPTPIHLGKYDSSKPGIPAHLNLKKI
jgi:hypothetical protein